MNTVRSYEIINYFGVWGHGPDECHEYECGCVTTTSPGLSTKVVVTHDDSACDCRYEINNMCREARKRYGEEAVLTFGNVAWENYYGAH